MKVAGVIGTRLKLYERVVCKKLAAKFTFKHLQIPHPLHCESLLKPPQITQNDSVILSAFKKTKTASYDNVTKTKHERQKKQERQRKHKRN